ncbi:hypothetical protein DIJ64_11805 [Mycobacterium leprae]|uniref:Uncharacterized protein n=1 Tax=Mycobacterium leprae TaxID=1769 RepID=A0AAD0KTK3_MYCLR|nr:hypothetical protein DIJ64_11805 [Mycobacterium leprae]OAR19969.1 hypothetical protein A8144_03140 [Mycobacterium leprae 3125609]OAX70953.1 hypothetical protein A3216_08980 [Mycobacterium leprae 7935681]
MKLAKWWSAVYAATGHIDTIRTRYDEGKFVSMGLVILMSIPCQRLQLFIVGDMITIRFAKLPKD